MWLDQLLLSAYSAGRGCLTPVLKRVRQNICQCLVGSVEWKNFPCRNYSWLVWKDLLMQKYRRPILQGHSSSMERRRQTKTNTSDLLDSTTAGLSEQIRANQQLLNWYCKKKKKKSGQKQNLQENTAGIWASEGQTAWASQSVLQHHDAILPDEMLKHGVAGLVRHNTTSPNSFPASCNWKEKTCQKIISYGNINAEYFTLLSTELRFIELQKKPLY